MRFAIDCTICAGLYLLAQMLAPQVPRRPVTKKQGCAVEPGMITKTLKFLEGQNISVLPHSVSDTFQVDKLVAGFTDAGSGTLAQGGLYLGGTKYLVIPGDPGAVIRGKKGQVKH